MRPGVVAALLIAALTACDDPGLLGDDLQELEVTATAYNSVPSQTNEQPHLGAWGDELRAGRKAVAVSHDLVALGLTRGRRVWIEGLGAFEVLDRLPRRWRRRIDIYMGDDVEAARQWGKREVTIRWRRLEDPTSGS